MVSLELEARLDNLLSIAQTETADIDLYKPIPERDECPICLIPLPIKENESMFMSCCGKKICKGCITRGIATDRRKGATVDEWKCAFCRQPPLPKTKQIKLLKKLMKKNNSHAFMRMATRYEEGNGVFQSDTKALEMYIRAAELGNVNACVGIGLCYKKGTAVERDVSKSIEYLEVAAKKGSLIAHQYLATLNERHGNIQTSIKHVKVAASAGDQDSMDDLMKLYKEKALSKEDLTQTLHAFQTAKDLMKSKDRDAIKAMQEQYYAAQEA